MRPRFAIPALLLMLAAPVVARASEQAPVLRFDPFVRPELALTGSSDARRSEAEWAPVLRSTLVAGSDSLANLGGVVLGVGDETHGYRLLRVTRFGAVFEREGTEVEFHLTPAETKP